jgi:hypothetical protein
MEDHHGHYASVCCRFGRTQDDHAHAIRQVGQRGHIGAPGCNEGKSLVQQDVTIEHTNTIMDNQARNQLTTFDHHKHVKELVSQQWSKCQ